MVSRTLGALLTVAAVGLAAGCTGGSDPTSGASATPDVTADSPPGTERPGPYRYPPAPQVADPDAALTPAATAAIERLLVGIVAGQLDLAAVQAIADADDVRTAWLLADLLRFYGGDDGEVLLAGFEDLAGVGLDDDPDLAQSPWPATTNHLIAWDTPAYPGYADDKVQLLLQVEPRWEPLLADADASLDWRHLNWGGVLIDDHRSARGSGVPGAASRRSTTRP